MIKSDNPTLALIKNRSSITVARALISLAICEVCDFFNISKNMNDTQIALTADLIIEQFWYFKLEEIKYCFRRALITEKVYDRIDGNIILGWLKAYDNERTEEAIRISGQEGLQRENQIDKSPDGMTFDQYLMSLHDKAKGGDKAASDQLARVEELEASMRLSSKCEHQKKLDFFKWRHCSLTYRKGKKS